MLRSPTASANNHPVFEPVRGSWPAAVGATGTVAGTVVATVAGTVVVVATVVVVDGSFRPPRARNCVEPFGLHVNWTTSSRPSDAVRSMFDVITSDFSEKNTSVFLLIGSHLVLGRFRLAVSGAATPLF